MATGTALSDTMEKDILERYLKNVTTNMGTLPTNVYVGLGTAISNEPSNALTEPSTTRGYTRQTLAFGGTAAGTPTTAIQITGPSVAVTFGPNTGSDWGTITHFGIFNNQTVGSGELMFWGALGSNVTIAVNDSFQFATGSITITAD